MKKKLLGVLLASFALVSVSQARFYVGVEGGYSTFGSYDTKLVNIGGDSAKKFAFGMPPASLIGDSLKWGPEGYSVGAVFGTEDFFGKYFGTRWGVNVGYTSFKDAVSFLDTGLNLDLMINFINTGRFSFGVFGGASIDYHYLLDKLPSEFGISSSHILGINGRVGVSALIASHHRIEFIAKLPIGTMNAANDERVILGSAVTAARTTFGASYKFVF